MILPSLISCLVTWACLHSWDQIHFQWNLGKISFKNQANSVGIRASEDSLFIILGKMHGNWVLRAGDKSDWVP